MLAEVENTAAKAELRNDKIKLQDSFDRATTLARELEAERPELLKEAKEANRLAKEVTEMRLELMRLGREKPAKDVRLALLRSALWHLTHYPSFSASLLPKQRRSLTRKSFNFKTSTPSCMRFKRRPRPQRLPANSWRKTWKPYDPRSFRRKLNFVRMRRPVARRAERKQRNSLGCVTGKCPPTRSRQAN